MNEKSPVSETSEVVHDFEKRPVVNVVDTTPTTPTTTQTSPAPVTEDVWQPGFLKRFPWLGVAGLLGVLLCAGLQAIVLWTSSGRSVQRWSSKVTPNVILNILNSVSGICFGVAITNGVAIVWWRKAMHGSTIKELHNSWCFTTSFKDIFLKWRYFNAAALAALVTKLTVIDGTLFQKATSTKIALSSGHNVKVPTFPTEDFPITGSWDALNMSQSYLEDSFTEDIWSWQSSADGEIYAVYGFYECADICFVRYQGLGFAADCTSTTTREDYIGDIAHSNNVVLNKEQQLFNVSFKLHQPSADKNYAWIQMDTTNWASVDANEAQQHCPGELNVQTCELRPAIISYPVTMNHFNASNLQRSEGVQVYLGTLNMHNGTYEGVGEYDAAGKQLAGFEVVKYIDLDNAPNEDGSSQLGGILNAMTQEYASGAEIYLTRTSSQPEDWSWTSSTDGLYSAVMENQGYYVDVVQNDPDENCPFNFNDPMPGLLTSLNELMFIMSNNVYDRYKLVPNGDFTPYQVNVTGTEFVHEVQYVTDYLYIMGALIATIFCVLCVLPSYWGYWELGRKATLSPIEIANAFQAPVLSDTHYRNGHADVILKEAGKQQVRYGHYTDEETGAGYRIITRNH